ncbi:hypothetical protein V8E36_005781 [Tilletia maclaganii]
MAHSSTNTPSSVSAPPTRQPPHIARFAPFDSPEHEPTIDELYTDECLDSTFLHAGLRSSRNRSQTTTPIALHAQAHLLGENVLTATQSSPTKPRTTRKDHSTPLNLHEAERRLREHQEQLTSGLRTPALSAPSSTVSVGSIESRNNSCASLNSASQSGQKISRVATTLSHPTYAQMVDLSSSPAQSFSSTSSNSSSGSPPFAAGKTHLSSATAAARKRSQTDRAKGFGAIGDQQQNSTPSSKDRSTGCNRESPTTSSFHQIHHHQSSRSMSSIAQLRADADMLQPAPSNMPLFGSNDVFSSPGMPALDSHPSFHLSLPAFSGQDNSMSSELGSSSLDPGTHETSIDSSTEKFKPTANSSSTLISDQSTSFTEALNKSKLAGSFDSPSPSRPSLGQAQLCSPSRLATKHRPPPLTLNNPCSDLGKLTGTTQASSSFAPHFLHSPLGGGMLPLNSAPVLAGMHSQLLPGFNPLASAAANLQQHGWPPMPLMQNQMHESHDSRFGGKAMEPGSAGSASFPAGPYRSGMFPNMPSFAQQGSFPGQNTLGGPPSNLSLTNTPLGSEFPAHPGHTGGPSRGTYPMMTPVTPLGPAPTSERPFGHQYAADAGVDKYGLASIAAGNLMPGAAADLMRYQRYQDLTAQLQARDSAVDALQKHIDQLNAQLLTLSTASDEHARNAQNPAMGDGSSSMVNPLSAHLNPNAQQFGALPGQSSEQISGAMSSSHAAMGMSLLGRQPGSSGSGMRMIPSAPGSSISASASDSESDSNGAHNSGDQYIGPKVLVERALGPRNQEATIVLQQQLKTGTPERKQAIVNAIAPHTLQLAFDKHGNFLLQRAISACPQLAWQMRGSFVQLSLSPYGCHVVQKILDEGEEYRVAIVKEMLENRLAETLTSRNSIHVWQKLLEMNWTSKEFRKSIFRKINDTMRGQWAHTALQETGSIICQNIFESADPEDRYECITEVLGNFKQCAMDQYGVWVAQHLVEHGDPEHRRTAMDRLLDDAVTLTLSQYGQKAIMSALRTNDEIFTRRFVDILCGQESTGGASSRRSVLVEIGSTSQGLQIVTQLLTSVGPTQREKLIQTVRRNSVFLKGSKTGLKVHQLCERARAFTGY